MITTKLNRWFVSSAVRLASSGLRQETRNGIRLCSFGDTFSLDVSKQFPLLTAKFTPWVPMIGELICFLQGYTNNEDFIKHKCNFWTANANSAYWKGSVGSIHAGLNGLGRIYSAQWRAWRSYDPVNLKVKFVDQITTLINNLREDPYSTRHVVAAWNPGEFDLMALPPCHAMFQVFAYQDTDGENRLSLQMYQRSADLALGVPINVASYASLLYLLCSLTGRKPGNLHFTYGNLHLYQVHIDEGLMEKLDYTSYNLRPDRIDDEDATNFTLRINQDLSLAPTVKHAPYEWLNADLFECTQHKGSYYAPLGSPFDKADRGPVIPLTMIE